MRALITGASSGIGLELARICAANHHDVILVARQEGKLRALASELHAAGVRADVVAVDLGKPGSAGTLADEVDRLGLSVDMLVNNAGFGLFGKFVETPLATEQEMIQLNIVTLTELTKRCLPAMVACRQGRILNVASTAAFLPGPLMAVYYATKAYVLSFSEAIANELEGTGVTVTVLCPGPTASGFQAAASLERSRLMDTAMATSRSVAEAGYEAMMAGQVVCIPGLLNKLTAAGPRFMPRGVMRRAVRRFQDSKESKK
jgi:short-subunit dehydrogenase